MSRSRIAQIHRQIAQLHDELAAEIAERRLGVVNGIDYRPPCPRTGVGPDGVERFCANHIRHPGRCEFIYLAVKR